MTHRAEIRFAVDHPTAAGHFPGNPIIPGAVLLREAIAAVIAQATGQTCRTVASAKFLSPVRPGDAVSIAWTMAEDGGVRFDMWLTEAATKVLTGALRLGPS